MPGSGRKIQLILASGTAATVAFLAGKYYEQERLLYKSGIPARPALPIYGTVPAVVHTEEPNMTPENVSSFSNKVNKMFSKLVPTNFVTIKAASPMEPSLPTMPNNPGTVSHSTRIGQIMKYGFPGMDNIISYKDYVVSYDRRNKVPHWVFEHLTEDSVRGNKEVDRSKCQFKEDTNIHPFFRSSNSDYRGSGYDRGHLAAAGNHKSCQEHIEETFFLTNIAPQVGEGFNRHSWNRLEKYVRKLTKKYANVYCCTGPLYLPRLEADGKNYITYEVIGPNLVAVPTHFFKVVVGERNDGILDMECYVMENGPIDESEPLKTFQVNPNVVERAAGLLFFNNVSKKRLLTINGAKA